MSNSQQADALRQDRRILVTGCSGHVGQPTVRALADAGHHVTGLDLVKPPDDLPVAKFVQTSLLDMEGLREALSDCDTVIHLAAAPSQKFGFIEHLLPRNIEGTWRLYEAMRESEVTRIIMTSSVQVSTGDPNYPKPLTADMPVQPGNDYACTKVFCEALARQHYLKRGLETCVLRLGWVVRNEQERDKLISKPALTGLYLSQQDLGRLMQALVSAPRMDWHIVYGVSLADEPYCDMSEARKLGYEPCDQFPEGLAFVNARPAEPE